MKTSALSLRLANDLPPGTHHLYNDQLRAHFGLSRVTAKARREIAYELQRLGLEVLSDPEHEPLVVRRTVRAAAGARGRGPRTPWWKRRWAIAAGAVLLLLMIAGALGDGEPTRGGDPEGTPRAQAAPADEAPPSEPAPATLEDAAVLVDAADYRAALDVAATLGDEERDRVRRKISRHLAKRARAALRSGSRATARRLLRRSSGFPSTPEAAAARADLEAADARAAYRAEQRRIRRAAAREAARAAAAERAAAEEAAAAAAEEYDAPAVDAGGSSTNWCGKRDGDGDGIYCED